mgnify:FL=1
MTDMIYQKVKKYIIQHQMIMQGDFVAAGVSGGADSVCMLYLLKQLQKDIPYRLTAVHVNHQVREDADADASYVKKLCDKMEIPCYLKKVDMCEYARQHKLSSEEAGRVLRYQAFKEVLHEQKESRHGKIAVAHNANDRAETMLFHMFRGSGLAGVGSIRPVRDQIIRPVLCLTREETENYLKKRDISYCQDSTNEEDLYARNRIRHHILPYAEKEICAGAVPHMNDLADILMETEVYLSRETKRLFQMYADDTADPIQCLRIWGKGLLTQDPVMVKRVLLYALEQMTPHRKDITGQHIKDLLELIRKDGSKELSLPYGIKAYKEYETLFLQKEQTQTPDRFSKEQDGFVVKPPVEIFVPGAGSFSFILVDRNFLSKEHDFSQKEQNIPQNRYTKWFDYDKITTSLLLRTRKTGDYLTIDKALHTQSLKQYMINEKIPKMQRDSMYILADGSHVLWVPGYRTSQYYKVDESTKCILQVQIRGGYHGGTN